MPSPEAARRVYEALRPRADKERPTCVIRRYKSEDSPSEWLLTEWSTGEVELAERPSQWSTWGPPRSLRLVSEERA